MSFLGRLFGRGGQRSTVNTAHPRDPVLAEWFGGGADQVAVTPKTVVGIPAVQACVGILQESIGAMPVSVWRKTGERFEERQEATGHPLHALLTGRPCGHMTGVEWVEWLVGSCALRGDAFAEIRTNRQGELVALVPLPFEAVEPELKPDDGVMRYRIYGQSGQRRLLQDDEMFRLPWKIQPDGSSLSPISLQRQSFAVALAARQYQLKLLQNGAAPKGGVKIPNSLSDEAAETLVRSWEKRHQGPENAGRFAVFDGGMEWVNIGMSNADAQFVDLMQMSLRDVARLFRIQPHKIGDLENSSLNNIEHQGIEFVTDTILPWVRRIEARMEAWILTEAERAQFSVEFNLRGLLRGDAKARAELYKALFYASAITPNEIRRMEGMNPVEGGDRFYIQTGTSPTDIIDQVLLKSTPRADRAGDN